MKTTKKYSGQSLVEFALLFPLLIFLVMGLFDIGRAVLYYAILNTGAREGTRYAIVQPVTVDTKTVVCPTSDTPESNICDEIQSKFFNIDDLNRSTITITYSPSTLNSNDTLVNIGIELAYQPFTPGLGLIGNINLNAESQMMLTPIARP